MPRVANPDRVPNPKKSPTGLGISVRFSIEDYHLIREMSEAEDRSMSYIVNQLVREGLSALDKRTKARNTRAARSAA